MTSKSLFSVFYIVLALCCLVSVSVRSQVCTLNVILFQDDIDNFQARYGPCTSIDGRITILDGVTNLRGLRGIESVGSLGIARTELKDLAGLEDLTHIESDFALVQNDQLASTTDLQNLQFIEGDVIIRNNKSLTEVDFLENVLLEQRFIIVENSSLAQCCGILKSISNSASLDILIEDNLPRCNSVEEVLTDPFCFPTVPTLGEWALIILMLFMITTAVSKLRTIEDSRLSNIF